MQRLREFGEFRIEREIGRGGFAAVYMAVHAPTGRRMALKIMLPETSRSASHRRRFQREVRALGSLDHPAIATRSMHGVQDGVPWFALEYVRGGTLADRLEERRRCFQDSGELPSEAECRSDALWAARVARALQHAHQRGVLHRDVKPQNILLGPGGEPTLADFGLAVFLEESGNDLTLTGEMIGTPAYMAPEQALGGRAAADARADVWSLAATLYESLTLRRPFPGTHAREVLAGMAAKEPPPLRTLNPAVPPALERAVLKALARDPERRQPTAAAFATQLEAAAAGTPPARSRRLQTLTVAVLLVAAAAVAWSIRRGDPARAAQRTAPEAAAEAGFVLAADARAAIRLEARPGLEWRGVDLPPPREDGLRVLPPGDYRMEIRRPGRRTWRRSFALAPGERPRLAPATPPVETLWSADWERAPAGVVVSAGEAGGLLVCRPAGPGRVALLRLDAGGRERWSRELAGSRLLGARVADLDGEEGLEVAACVAAERPGGEACLHCLGEADGTVLWSLPLGDDPPALQIDGGGATGRLLLAGSDGLVLACSGSGSILTRIPPAEGAAPARAPVWMPPATGEWLGLADGRLLRWAAAAPARALRGATGRLTAWVAAGSSEPHFFALENAEESLQVEVVLPDGTVVARSGPAFLGLAAPLDRPAVLPPGAVGAPPEILVLTARGLARLVLAYPMPGLRWERRESGNWRYGPLLADFEGTGGLQCVIAAEDGGVACLDAQDGRHLWSAAAPAALAAPPVAQDLDGDGRAELILAHSRGITVLRAPALPEG